MDRKAQITLFVVSTVLYLIYLTCSYYELDRYLYCKVYPLNTYIENYQTRTRREGQPRVVITMTTTPDRMPSLHSVLSSLLDQTVKVDQIALNLPYKYDGQNYTIGEDIKKVANIYRTRKQDNTVGLLPTLKREGEYDTVIILLNDRCIYGKDFIETLLDSSKENPTSAIFVKDNPDIGLYKPNFVDPKILYDTGNNVVINNYLRSDKKEIEYSGNYGC